MTEHRSRNLCRWLEEMSLLTRAALLLGVLVVATGLLLPVAWFVHGPSGLAACAVAFALCIVPALISLGVAQFFSGSQGALYSLLIGMLLRMGVPLAGCVAAFATVSWLAEGGLAYYLLVLYPVMLCVETILTASAVQTQPTQARLRHG